MAKVIILSRVVIDLDNRLVLQWDDKLTGRLWLYMRDATNQYFDGLNAIELWDFYTKGDYKNAQVEGWKDSE